MIENKVNAICLYIGISFHSAENKAVDLVIFIRYLISNFPKQVQ